MGLGSTDADVKKLVQSFLSLSAPLEEKVHKWSLGIASQLQRGTASPMDVAAYNNGAMKLWALQAEQYFRMLKLGVNSSYIAPPPRPTLFAATLPNGALAIANSSPFNSTSCALLREQEFSKQNETNRDLGVRDCINRFVPTRIVDTGVAEGTTGVFPRAGSAAAFADFITTGASPYTGTLAGLAGDLGFVWVAPLVWAGAFLLAGAGAWVFSEAFVNSHRDIEREFAAKFRQAEADKQLMAAVARVDCLKAGTAPKICDLLQRTPATDPGATSGLIENLIKATVVGIIGFVVYKKVQG